MSKTIWRSQDDGIAITTYIGPDQGNGEPRTRVEITSRDSGSLSVTLAQFGELAAHNAGAFLAPRDESPEEAARRTLHNLEIAWEVANRHGV